MNRILVAIVALVIWTGLAFAAGWAWRADRADLSEVKRDTADATAVVEAVQDARQTEHTQADKMADIGAKHEEDRRDAQSLPATVAAAVRSGDLRLRDELPSCATDRLSIAAASAVERDEAARVRSEIAGLVVQVGRDADDHVNACQAVIQADREAP